MFGRVGRPVVVGVGAVVAVLRIVASFVLLILGSGIVFILQFHQLLQIGHSAGQLAVAAVGPADGELEVAVGVAKVHFSAILFLLFGHERQFGRLSLDHRAGENDLAMPAQATVVNQHGQHVHRIPVFGPEHVLVDSVSVLHNPLLGRFDLQEFGQTVENFEDALRRSVSAQGHRDGGRASVAFGRQKRFGLRAGDFVLKLDLLADFAHGDQLLRLRRDRNRLPKVTRRTSRSFGELLRLLFIDVFVFRIVGFEIVPNLEGFLPDARFRFRRRTAIEIRTFGASASAQTLSVQSAVSLKLLLIEAPSAEVDRFEERHRRLFAQGQHVVVIALFGQTHGPLISFAQFAQLQVRLGAEFGHVAGSENGARVQVMSQLGFHGLNGRKLVLQLVNDVVNARIVVVFIHFRAFSGPLFGRRIHISACLLT